MCDLSQIKVRWKMQRDQQSEPLDIVAAITPANAKNGADRRDDADLKTATETQGSRCIFHLT